MPLRRLGRAEYENTLRSLFGSTVAAGVTLGNDGVGASTYGWASDVGGVERDLFEQAASNIAYDPKLRIGDFAPCPAAMDQRACAASFTKTFGRRVFRRALTAEESAQLMAVYDAGRQAPLSDDHETALRTTLAAMLQSPEFLYHWELGAAKPVREGALVRLNGAELASRLSYFLWASAPDETLMTAADSGALDSAVGLEKEARRLLSDKAQASSALMGLYGVWFELNKLPALVKDPTVFTVTEDLKLAMAEELRQFLSHAVLDEGKWSTVLSSHDSFVNGPLAALYGMTGVTGNTFVAKTLPPERVGLLTLSSFLAIKALPQESSPVRRGKMISERLLCRTIPPPPPDVNAMPPEIPEGIQTREAYERHRTDPTCAACHVRMDPLGFAFENFDAAGRYRAMEAGKPVDTSGMVQGLDGKDVPFKTTADLMTALATSPEAQQCAVSQWMRFALGRKLVDGDQASVVAINRAFTRSNLDLRELAVALVLSDAFRFRSPAEGEVLQ